MSRATETNNSKENQESNKKEMSARFRKDSKKSLMESKGKNDQILDIDEKFNSNLQQTLISESIQVYSSPEK